MKIRCRRRHAPPITVKALLAVLALMAGLVVAPVASADSRLDFTGTTVTGAPFNGSSLQGKPVVLWFWTPWCPFCNQEAPGVSQVAAANPRVTFVGIAARSDPAAMQGFVVEVQPELHQPR